MNPQEQMNHIKELIQFLENQCKGLQRWTSPTNTKWLTDTNNFLNKNRIQVLGIQLPKSTIAIQNEFCSFTSTWLERVHSGKSTTNHLGQCLMAGVYIRHLTRVYKELLETLDNKPPQKENHD